MLRARAGAVPVLCYRRARRRRRLPTAAAVYKPGSSTATADQLASWISEKLPDDLSRVPGVGPASVAVLAAAEVPITSCAQLVGQFLLFKGKGVEMRETADAFTNWLKLVGVKANTHTITHAVAEKACVILGAPYNPEVRAPPRLLLRAPIEARRCASMPLTCARSPLPSSLQDYTD